MLVVRALEDIPSQGIRKNDELRFYVVDAHHHMGREKSHRNTPSGAYEFYALLWFELQRMSKDLVENGSQLFEPVRVEAVPVVEKLFASDESWSSSRIGWLVDRTIVFPYNDDYSRTGYPANPSFQVSNDRIAGWTTRAPNSARLIGFARVDPNDEKSTPGQAVGELHRAVRTLGLRGLKLHPLSQLFVDEMTDNPVLDVVSAAGLLGVPVIFDTRNIRTARKIAEIAKLVEARTKGAPVPPLIVAHCGMSPGDPGLYETLLNPHLYAETSTLHGNDIPVLFRMAHERLGTRGRNWAEKLLFGTDYSFLSVQAVEVILYLLSRDFPGNATDIQRILGGNALSLAQKSIGGESGQERKPVHLVVRSREGSMRDTLESTLISVIHSNDWDLCSIDFMKPPRGTWPEVRPGVDGGFNGVYLGSYVMTVVKRANQRRLQIWVHEQAGSPLTCSLMDAGGPVALATLELASQAMNPELLSSLSQNSTRVETPEGMKQAITKMLT